MSQSTDGTFTSALQHGSKQVSLPLQADGNYHATLVRRNYIAAPASAYEPILSQRTSYTALLKYSDDFSQTNWTKVNTTAAVSSAVYDPEGGYTSSKIAEDTTNGAHNASQAATVASGALAFGVFVKAAERTFVRLRIYNATDNSLGNAVFNLSTGVLVSGTGAIKKLLGGWYWCSTTGTPSVSNSSLFIDLGTDATTWSYTGTTGSGVYLWRATAYLSSSIGPAIATTATTPGAVTPVAVDVDDPTAFLVNEQETDSGALELGIARWSREYANIPKQLIVPGSIQYTRPIIYNEYLGLDNLGIYDASVAPPVFTLISGYNAGTLGAQNGDLLYDFTGKRLFAPARACALALYGVAAGGTFTITYGANTTAALAYNVSNADLATAINGLASVIAAGVTVTATNSLTTSTYPNVTIAITVGSTSTPFTLNGTGLTLVNGLASKLNFTQVAAASGANSQFLWMAATLTCVGHGFTNTGQKLAVVQNGTNYPLFIFSSTQWAVVNADLLAVPACNLSGAAINGAYVAPYKQQYTPGIASFPSRNVSDFYLPGFSPGIATATDITIPAGLTNDNTLLAALATGSGWTCYQVQGLTFWKGPIMRLEQTQINIDNV